MVSSVFADIVVEVISCSDEVNRTRGRPEGDLLIMGSLHPDYAAHNSTFHELHAAAEEDTGGA